MRAGAAIAAGLVVTGQPSLAECLGQGCYDGLVMMLASFLAYVMIALTLLVMLVREKWRKAGLRMLLLVLAVAVGVPLVSQGWAAFRQGRVEAREVVGEPPPMTGRVPLVLTTEGRCLAPACDALLLGRGAAGVYLVETGGLSGVDWTRPVPLADLPLMFQTEGGIADGEPRVLTAVERAEAAARIDYLVLAGLPFDLLRFGNSPDALRSPVEAGLAANTALEGLDEAVLVDLAMAPLVPGAGVVDLKALRFDLLDLWVYGDALALPLAPGNRQSVRNSPAGAEAAARSFCPLPDGSVDGLCLDLIDG